MAGMIEEDIKLDDVQLLEQVSKKTNKPYTVLVMMSNNTQYRAFPDYNKTTPVKGDTVRLQYEKVEGKTPGMFFNHVQSYTVVPAGAKEKPVTIKAVATTPTVEHKTVAPKVETIKTTDWAAKDLSMEISGLLQAIIQRSDVHIGQGEYVQELLDSMLEVKREAERKWRR